MNWTGTSVLQWVVGKIEGGETWAGVMGQGSSQLLSKITAESQRLHSLYASSHSHARTHARTYAYVCVCLSWWKKISGNMKIVLNWHPIERRVFSRRRADKLDLPSTQFDNLTFWVQHCPEPTPPGDRSETPPGGSAHTHLQTGHTSTSVNKKNNPL